MSFVPEEVQAELEYEIERRISHDSPTKYDINFYLRKVGRLEDDLNQVQDQLSKARVRLRRAQDFQIKYDLLIRQNTTLMSDLEKREKEYCELRSKYEIMKVQIEDRHIEGEDWSTERKSLIEQIDKWKNRFAEVEEIKKNEIISNREKSHSQIKHETESIKREFSEKETQYQNEIRQLKKVIYEKETVETIVSNKVEKVRKQKDEEIVRLGAHFEAKKQEHAGMIQEKNEELEKLREKFEKMFNFEIQNLKKTIDDQDELFGIEVNGLRELLSLKNDEISKLLQQIKDQYDEHERDRESIQKELAIYKQKIYSIERQNELELYNVKERLTKIHALEIEALEKRYNDLVNSLKNERNELYKILEEKEKLMDDQKKDMERIKDELYDRLKERDTKITQLQERIKQFGDIDATDMKNLHESFHQIETQKQTMTNQYQVNVSFLNQQISKLTSSNELKNNEIKQLHQQIMTIKKNQAESLRQIEDAWREQKGEWEEQRQRERERVDKMQEQQRMKEKQWKNKQRHLEREREKEEREKTKTKYICEELEREIERLNQNIKQLDENLKKEMKQNQLSMLDTGGVRRELTGELEKQKSELQAIKRMEVDQIRRKLEIQITHLTNQNEKMKTDLLNKELAYGNLEAEFKKLEHINKNIQKINKERLIEYQKKMATLNNEINLTQNLYQSFLKATSRKVQNSP